MPLKDLEDAKAWLVDKKWSSGDQSDPHLEEVW